MIAMLFFAPVPDILVLEYASLAYGSLGCGAAVHLGIVPEF
jgi:hypothetical protein